MLASRLIAFPLMAGAIFGCRGGAPSPASQVLDGPEVPAAGTTADPDAVPAAAPDCGTVDAVSSESMTGEAVFDLTSRCVFDRDVHDVRIRILSETFKKVLDDGCADIDSGYGHVIELILDGRQIKDVGIKVRGNTSKCNPKRQFKLKFDAKEAYSVYGGTKTMIALPENDGRTFFGLGGISLRTSSNDPSMVRERVSSRLFAHAETLKKTAERGGLVYRVAFSKLYVSFNRTAAEGPEGSFTRLRDGYYYDYKGFYSLAENIDKVFLRSRFQIGDTKLKGFSLFQADLAAASFEKATYKRIGWPADFVDGKKAEDEAQIVAGEEKLFALFDLLANNATDEAIELAIDVDNIVNYVAAAIMAGHWDSMLANRNNDFLFLNGATKKWQVLTWDLDNSQGVIYDQYKALMQKDIYAPALKYKSKLFTELFASTRPAFRQRLKERLGAYASGFSSAQKFNGMIDELQTSVKQNVEDWEGFDANDFNDLKSFAKARREAVTPQVTP